jgi:tRNA(Ile2) C34 agmatinyltransferase TiaS
MIFIGLDDTDTMESRGTGKLARQIARTLAADFCVHGVTRHQLLTDPSIQYTKKNSSAAILLDSNGLDPNTLAERVGELIRADFQAGSDPGLCIGQVIPEAVRQFGHRAKYHVLTQEEARGLAAVNQLILEGVGGDESGVIGALAAVGLAASGEDGRYVQVGHIRDMKGLKSVSSLLEADLISIQTLDGQIVTHGLVLAEKLRPARRDGTPVLYVEWNGKHWNPLKVD